jgi:hypothetical protein
MFFTGRNQRDLTEIKEITSDVREGAREALERLGQIHELHQRQLGARGSQQPRPLIAFVHIPKTAGATVTTMFSRAYSKAGLDDAGNYMRGPENAARKLTRRPGGWEIWQRRGGRVTAGHVPYRIFREHLPPDALYMTFLREPVDRVLSHYYRHIHRTHAHTSPGPRQDRAESLEQALVELRLPQVNNLATRFLCGHPSRDDDLAASALDDAKANLRNFAFVGIQERFDESLVLLQRTLGLRAVPYVNRHVSAEGGRPLVDEIPDEQRRLIAEFNQLDAELYEFGVALFEKAVAGAGDGFADDVDALRSRSDDVREEEWRQAALPAEASGSHSA